MDAAQTKAFIDKSWNDSVLSTLEKYVSIPNQSQDFDPEIHTNGYQEQACDLLTNWVKAQNVQGLQMKVLHEKNRTPLIFIEIPAFNNTDNTSNFTVLMYGHFDKQPPLTEDWDEDLFPWKPVIKDGKLYGRGGADDGYAIFAAIDSIRALQAQNLPHSRCCIVIEGSEESGSPDLLYYLAQLQQEIGAPRVVICLDSGCQNYDQLWMTVSLRGFLIAFLKTQLLTEGIHSGGSGLVRDSFHVLRLILDRLDNAETGVMLNELATEIPASHRKFAMDCVSVMGAQIYKQLPFYDEHTQPQIRECHESDPESIAELLLNQTWRPQLSITGIDGIPGLQGGNVLRKHTTVKLSVRIPPNKDPKEAQQQLKAAAERKPLPYNAHVECRLSEHCGAGFCCPEYEGWLSLSLQKASQMFFSKPAQFTGEGGSIPFMGELQRTYPQAQFVITGVLGPNSNAHGPNEFLHIAYCKSVICCIANILYDIGVYDRSGEDDNNSAENTASTTNANDNDNNNSNNEQKNDN